MGKPGDRQWIACWKCTFQFPVQLKIQFSLIALFDGFSGDGVPPIDE
jgi:hypothetical protein